MNKSKKKITLSERMDQLTTRMDHLTAIVENGFKRIDSRLDYIVKANNLKDLPYQK